jgi:hypothetical protein
MTRSIYHLVALRRTLWHLHLEENPNIDDNAVPPLLCLSKLRFLSLIDTGLGMAGVRRLALSLEEAARAVDVTVPLACEEYISSSSFDNLFLFLS